MQINSSVFRSVRSRFAFGLRATAIGTMVLAAAAATAQAETRFARSALWQAPYESQVAISLSSRDTWLKADCESFKSLVFDSQGRLIESQPDIIDSYRKMAPDEVMQLSYVATFKIESGLDWLASQSTIASNDSLPVAKQNLTESRSRLFSDRLGELRAQFKPGSMAQQFAKLGLKVLPIRVLYRSGMMVVQVDSKDVACDLLERKVEFKSTGEGQVVPKPEDQKALDQFYGLITDRIAPLITSEEAKEKRQIRVAYRLGELLATNGESETSIENSLVAFNHQLFKPDTMEPTSAWQYFAKAWTLVVSGSTVRAPFELTWALK